MPIRQRTTTSGLRSLLQEAVSARTTFQLSPMIELQPMIKGTNVHWISPPISLWNSRLQSIRATICRPMFPLAWMDESALLKGSRSLSALSKASSLLFGLKSFKEGRSFSCQGREGQQLVGRLQVGGSRDVMSKTASPTTLFQLRTLFKERRILTVIWLYNRNATKDKIARVPRLVHFSNTHTSIAMSLNFVAFTAKLTEEMIAQSERSLLSLDSSLALHQMHVQCMSRCSCV